MTLQEAIKEAIKEAETQIDVYENMILYNKDFEPQNDNSNYERKIEFLKIAIETLEKQIPKKPVLENTKGIVGINMWHCPVCKNEIISDWNRDIANSYCHHCGQALDWSEK